MVLQVTAVMSGQRQGPARELLLANHSFPGEYIVKAFGPGDGVFAAAVAREAVAVVSEARLVVSERGTRSGHRVCVTLTMQAESVDEVLAVYERMYAIDGLMLIL